MKTISKFLIFTLVILLVSLGTITATENVTSIDSKDITDTYKDHTDNIKDISTDNIQANEKIIEKNTHSNEENNTKKASQTITVTSNTYDLFFKQKDNTEFAETTDYIRSGDTINLKGTFKNLKFAVDKNITFTSIDHDAKLEDCTVYVLGQNASGSIIANLNIFNNGTLKKGIQVKDASNLLIENNTIKTLGLRAYGFVADYMNHSTIRNNHFEREGDDWRYITFLIGVSFYNNIANNTIRCGGANGIYLSIYGSQDAQFVGGQCDYNNITGNNVTAVGDITSWCYTIQVMGAYNLVANNTVNGGFRGISTQDYENNIIIDNDVHAINEGIYACEGATVYNNNVHVTGSSRGITIGSANVKIYNNTITTEDGAGIDIRGDNALIANNTIISANGTGIYSKGTNKYINIDNNRITSKKEGILFKQQTRTKKMNHILVNRNIINSEAEYAINFQEVGSLTASEINVTVTGSNVLTSSRGSGAAAYLKPTNSNQTSQLDSNQVITITPANYPEWFTNQVANNNIEQNATIYLEGTFTNTSFTFNKKVHIIGRNCKINDGTITLTADAHLSTITNITIKNTKNDTTVHGIELLEVNNCQITNVNIDNYAEYESLGIFIYGANGNTITNNTIKTSGNYVNNAILSYSSDSNTIENNQININQSNKEVQYDDSIMFNEKIGTIQEVLHNHGIILLYSSGNTINNNNVNATSMFKTYTFPTTECRNSLVGIDVYFDSHNNKITNNNVSVEGYGPYNYGIGVLGGYWGSSILASNATNNHYEYNNVKVTGGYFATGFIAGRNSVNTILRNNNITIDIYKNSTNRGDYAHGVTLENSTNTDIISNNITSTGSSLYSIELFDSGKNNINNNTITGNATYPYGIAATRSSNNNILNNTIILQKVNLGTSTQATHSESIESGDETIMFTSQSTNNNIKYNTLKTNAERTIKLTSETSNNNVTENSLIAKTLTGDKSVENQANTNIVKNNFIYFVNITVSPVYAMIGDQVTLNATVTTDTTDTRNLTAYYRIGTADIGSTQVVNGKAVLTYRVPVFFNPTTYQLTVKIEGINFQNATGINTATFTKAPEEVNVNVNKALTTAGSNVALTAIITTGTGGKIGSGQAEFYVNNEKIGTTSVKLGNANITYTIPANEVPAIKTVKVKYLGTADYRPSEGNNTLGIQSKSSISVADTTGKLGEQVSILANVTSGAKAVNGATARISIGSHNIANVTIVNGKVTYKYTIDNTFSANTYNLQVAYDGNDTQTSASKTGKIIIQPYTTVFNYNNTVVAVGSNVSLVLCISNGKKGTDYYAANGGNVSIILNGKTLTDSSGKDIIGIVKDGQITFTFTAPTQLAGSQNITFTYSGNNKFTPHNQTYNGGLVIEEGLIPTKITLDSIKTVQYRENITITGKLTDNTNKAINNANINLTINKESYIVTTNSKGIFSYKTNASITGTNNITANYNRNGKYLASNTKTTFTVEKQDLKITLNKISDVVYGHNVTVTGTFTDGLGNARANSALKILINGKSISTRTDSNGKFTVESKVGVIGTNNVTALRSGDKNYNTANTTTTFRMVKQDLKITVDKISNVVYGSQVKISGTLKDGDGNLRANTGVKILINGKSATAKTDKNGKYIFTTKIGKLGINNVTVSHNGGTNYNPTSNSTTYTVVKQDLKITLNKIGTVTYGSVTITGRFTDSTGNPRANTGLKITINGKTATAKTNDKGEFTLTTKVGAIGTNNVTAYHNGGSNYNPTSTTTTFKMVKQDLKVTIDPINTVTYGNSVVITGKFTDASGKVRANSAIKIIINGKTLTTRTDASGKFRATSKVGSIGINNVTVSHNGGTGFNPTSTSTTFKMIKQDLKITINPISAVKKGSTLTVTGTFTDANGKIRANTNLKVKLNGMEYTTRTDTKGAFTFKATANKVGTNTISMSHAGGANYNPTNCTVLFTVIAS